MESLQLGVSDLLGDEREGEKDGFLGGVVLGWMEWLRRGVGEDIRRGGGGWWEELVKRKECSRKGYNRVMVLGTKLGRGEDCSIALAMGLEIILSIPHMLVAYLDSMLVQSFIREKFPHLNIRICMKRL